MANDLEIRIGAELSEIKGALNQLQNELRDTGRTGDRSGRQAAGGFDGLQRTINRATGALAGFLTVYSAISALRGVVRITDEYARFNAQLKLVTDSQQELNEAQRETYRIAQQTRAPLADVANTYAILERSTEGFNTSQEQVVRVLETVNKSIALTPTSADSARASLVQFGQALAGDFKAGAQELNSILEQTPGLAIAIAKGLGVPVGQLKRLGEEGELSAERVFNALLRVSEDIDEQFKKVPLTVGGALTQLQNDVLMSFGQADTSALVGSITELRTVLTDPAIQEGLLTLAEGLTTFAAAATTAAAETANFVKFISEELAARIGGAALDDLPRVRDELERLTAQREKLNSLYGKSEGFIEQEIKPLDQRIALLEQVLANAERGLDYKGDPVAGGEEGESSEERTRRLREEAEARLELSRAAAQEAAEKKRLEAEAKQRQKTIDKMIASLKEEVETHGQGTAAVVRYRLENLGAKEGEIERAVALAEEKDALDAKAKAEKEAAEVTRRLARQLVDVQARVLEGQGQIAASTRLRLEAQYKDLIEGLRQAGNEEGAGLVENLIDTEVTRAQFEEVKRQFDQTLADLQNRQQGLANQVQIGSLSPEAADEQQREARAQAMEQLQGLTQQMQALAQATNDPAIVEGANAATQALQRLAIEGMDGTARAMMNLRAQWANLQRNFAQATVDAGVNAVTQLFTDIASGSKSAGDALKDFVRNFAASMAQIAARALATFLVLRLLDAVYPGLGQATAATMSVGASVQHRGGMVGTGPKRHVNPMLFLGAPRYHNGGMVGLKPDERPAILQTGEEVLSRTDPRNQANGGGTPNGYRIVNVVDPSMAGEFIESAAGERAILNVISRNGGAVRESIGS